MDSFSSIFDLAGMIDEIFGEGTYKEVSKLPDCMVSSVYPPANVYEDSDKNYVIEVAVAGWKDSEIGLKIEDMKLVLTLTPDAEAPKVRYMQHGIRHSATTVRFGIHPRYDLKTLKASQAGGILTIKLPLKEEAKPSTVEIKKG